MLAAGLGSGEAAVSCNRTKDVTVGERDDGELFFSRSRVTIRQGSCVRWTWTGVLEHELEART